MKNILKQLTAYITIFMMVTVHTVPARVLAQEVPTPPAAPSAPSAPTAPTAPSAPTPPQAPTVQQAISDMQNNDSDNEEEEEHEDEENHSGNTGSSSNSSTPTPTPTQAATNQQQSGQVGSSDVKTGDAVSSGVISTSGNNNTSTSPAGTTGSGATVVNSGNGSDSTNNGSAAIVNNDNTYQNNAAVVNSNLTGATVTGQNDTSKNVGDSSIKTGDANTTGTIITSVNTNADGVMVSEFNVVDDHVGDIVLDFGAACISGCGGAGSLFAGNTGNGADSENTADTDVTNNSNSYQMNDALIGNDLNLTADSGNNTANKNTGGDSNIETGDANVAANVLTFANNNLAGNVVFGVVNIFGDLIGDLIFDESQFDALGTTALNSGNGSGSTNTANSSTTNNANTFQENDANITNNLIFDASTGENSASDNTGGSSTIKTGDTNIDANVLNIANMNLAGGNWWIVLVNEAGNWMGKIMGAPEGTKFAAVQGTDYSIDENGYITVSNAGNGAGSTNDASSNVTNNSTTVQDNNANIVNNLNLSANTGGNSTSKNTGGNSNITTGDANIVANMVNFVNNNITGNGKLVVTVVNVFGSWLGDFVTPGQKKEKTAQVQNNSNNIGGASDNNDSTKSTPTPTPTVAAQQKTVARVGSGNANNAVTTQNTGNGNVAVISEGNGSVQPTPQVKGASYSVVDAAKKNVIRINLAWAMLLLPVLAVAYLSRRFVLNRRSA